MPPLDLGKLSQLNFEEPDTDRFPCLALAYEALKAGGTMPAVLNAANEVAVKAFLDGMIRLSDIPRINSQVMRSHIARPAASIEDILAADREARASANGLLPAAVTSAGI